MTKFFVEQDRALWDAFHPDAVSSGAPVIDLRQQFNDLVLGNGAYRGIGVFILLRQLSRDRVRCPCWDEVRGSSSECKYCHGEIFTWTEKYVRAYFTQTYGRAIAAPTEVSELRHTGIYDLDKALIYLPFDAEPATGDALYRIRLNLDGRPYYPLERIEKWRAVNVEDRRQEMGHVAFWMAICERTEF